MLEQIGTSVLTFLLGSALTYISTRWSTSLKKIDSLEFGVQALLRDRMIMMHKYYKEKDKPIPQREVDSFESMYEAYKLLNGNGYIDDVRHIVVEVMPHENS